jgi:hypothetical protein
MKSGILKKFKTTPTEKSIILICVVKNEESTLPFFISYYKNLGVTHFAFIENNSTDNTLNILKKTNINMMLLRTSDCYKKNNFGMHWVNFLLKKWFFKKWCLVVDTDELLILKDFSLTNLRKKMKDENKNATNTMLIDFYPKYFKNTGTSKCSDWCHDHTDEWHFKCGWSSNACSACDECNCRSYKPGLPFYNFSKYIDKVDFNNFIIDTTLDGSTYVKGGVRQRIYNKGADFATLTKKTFFFNDISDTHILSAGMHWWIPEKIIIKFKSNWWEVPIEAWSEYNSKINYYDDLLFVGHFKYLRDNINLYFKNRLKDNLDWDGSIEYEAYANNPVDSFYSSEMSIECDSIIDVYKYYQKFVKYGGN